LIAAVVLIAAGCVGDQRIRKQSVQPPKKYYVVKKGDTLLKIARWFGTDTVSIKKANDLTLDSLSVGQRLIIPGRGSTASRDKIAKKAPEKKQGIKQPKKAVRINVKLRWPMKEGKITSDFGVRRSGKHDGIDISAPEGSSIYNAADGRVIFSGWGPTGYGRLIVIKHSPELFTVYAHNKKNLVKEGESVKKGVKIALVGRSGRVRGGSNLHFEVRINRIPRNPLSYLPKKPNGIR
jgi:murein DD-endopeptidase MepM/ murein hydrolase activator NlpD